MFPAFDNWKVAARFAALLLLLMLLPVFLAKLGLPPRSEVYNGLRVGGGPYVKTRQQLYATSGDIDIAFVGSSILNVAVNGDEVESRLAARFPGINVRMFGYVFQGYDMQYVMMRDLLEQRHVKMLVMSFSGPRVISDRPHVQLHNMLRFGEYPEMLDGLPFKDRASLYASSVLDGPRQLVKYLRPERPIDATDSWRSLMHFDSVPVITDPPAPAIVLSDATRGEFKFGDPEISERQKHFALLIAGLAAQHHVPLIVLNLPTPEEFGNDYIWERADWTHVLPGNPTVVAFRHSDLFGKRSVNQLFADSVHMTPEGQERYTRALIPYLMTRYEEFQTR
jgi:hypothetical protein